MKHDMMLFSNKQSNLQQIIKPLVKPIQATGNLTATFLPTVDSLRWRFLPPRSNLKLGDESTEVRLEGK